MNEVQNINREARQTAVYLWIPGQLLTFLYRKKKNLNGLERLSRCGIRCRLQNSLKRWIVKKLNTGTGEMTQVVRAFVL